MEITDLFKNFDISLPVERLNANEQLKQNSHLLRGDIKTGLADRMTGALPGEDPLLIKFHGLYQQDNRDLRIERAKRKLEPNFQFMVRLRMPGGLCQVQQWQALDRIADQYAEGSLRITTRQTVQIHGVRKSSLKSCMQAIRDVGLDTVAACGDDNRGVVCGISPGLSRVHDRIVQLAQTVSDQLKWNSRAYEEIWLDEPVSSKDEDESFYSAKYLPRKFKIGFALPPLNDVDIFAQDLGFIAIVSGGELRGFNVAVGGGMGQLDSREDSYPRAANVIGFIRAEEVMAFAKAVIGIQRDYGNRVDRHRARFKYTLDYYGQGWFVEMLERRWQGSLVPPEEFSFQDSNDKFGWYASEDGKWHAGLYIPSGRVSGVLKGRLSGFFQQFGGVIRLSTNQNIVLSGIDEAEKTQVQNRLDDLGLAHCLQPDLDQINTLACVGFPTCGLAMAESERYMPALVEALAQLKQKHGLSELPIRLRITGCPNGCARPYLAEVALTGRSPGRYNLYLGGDYGGQRLNTLYRENVEEEGFLSMMNNFLEAYKSAGAEESFGDFLQEMINKDGEQYGVINE